MIGEVAWIGSGLDLHPLDQAGALARQGERAAVRRREVGEIHVEAGRGIPADPQQLAHDPSAERAGGCPNEHARDQSTPG
jgi:hypothetical protein